MTLLKLLSLALTTVNLAVAQQVLQNASYACSGIASRFKHDNVTVNFAHHIQAGTNLTFDTTGDLEECRASQVASVDMCRVAMYVATSERSGITLEAWLPTNWTGRFLSTGNGGIAGCIQYEDMAYGNSFGFAAVGANNGHNGTSGKALLDNSDVVTDFAWRSLYTETVVGKALTEEFYQKSLAHSYYLGCSTGGRQGFKMVQDHPELFDGVVVGAPALDFNNLNSWSGHFLEITGTNTSDTFVSMEQWAIVHEDVLKQCDALDGVADGILEDPDLCQYNATGLQCAPDASNTSVCLSELHVQTVHGVLSNFTYDDGTLIFPRIQPGSELADRFIYYNGEAFIYTLDWFRYAIFNDPTWTADHLNDTAVAFAASKNPSDIRTWNGDLSAFRDKGGKILHYHGLMDSIITSDNSPRYYEHVASTMNQSPAELDSFYRFFRIGGMDHCSGGRGAWSIGQQDVPGNPFAQDPQYNVLQRLVEWVEAGDAMAPETVTGIKFVDDEAAKGVELERRHCRYPRRNECKDPENYEKPDAWECV